MKSISNEILVGLLLAKYHENLGFLERSFERFVKLLEGWDNDGFDVIVSKGLRGSLKLLFDSIKTFASLLHSILEWLHDRSILKLV